MSVGSEGLEKGREGEGGKKEKKKKYKKIPPPKKPPKRYHSAGSRTRLFPRGENGLLSSAVPTATRPRTWRGKAAPARARAAAPWLPAAGGPGGGPGRPRSPVPPAGGCRGQAPGEVERLHPAPATGLRKRLPRLPGRRTRAQALVRAPTCFRAPRPPRLLYLFTRPRSSL